MFRPRSTGNRHIGVGSCSHAAMRRCGQANELTTGGRGIPADRLLIRNVGQAPAAYAPVASKSAENTGSQAIILP